ncbi:phosphoethanolamine transferase [Flavobacterium sp. ALJ2]|uniref:phosphoethanolamine transferase n=1 Tax=Flavobacterium sp. ALJ2 TaxID=2786960 RepID=UPI00189D6D61|nr:phosphoethanolamine transferase [Flavobacterium sp. ALJ2]MBF7090611.1 phosphoethanolamine transferase [Flavobacterium sp. ALJ2]
MNRFNKYKKEKETFSFGVTNKEEGGKPDIVVLVIGERIRYSNWTVNGYKRSTSTNLDTIKSLISFDRHYSNGNSTVASIPLLITQATPQKPEIAYSEKTIVSLFKEAGYETVWISNQNIFDYINNKDEADELFELYKKRSTDLDIIPVFNEVVNKKKSKRKLIVVNMIGGHGEIPEEFNFYKPNSSKKNYPVTMENAPVFINNYDNMIKLQDFVLGKIINLVQKQNKSSIFMFTADHGCNLFDDSQALFGYGSQNPTEKETHIPLFIWSSSKYSKENTEKVNNLKKHKKYLTTNNNLFYTLADLSNIKYTDFKKNQSIADSTYLVYKERYVYINGNAMKFNSK